MAEFSVGSEELLSSHRVVEEVCYHKYMCVCLISTLAMLKRKQMTCCQTRLHASKPYYDMCLQMTFS